jgi:glutamine synthetase
MVRVPGAGRIEYRLADGAANPYLLQAALLAAGLDGIAHARRPGKRLDLDMYVAGHGVDGARRLPLNLLDAIRAFETCDPLRQAFGAAFMDSYAKLKRQEWDAYMRHLTQWERDTTLDC